MLKPFLKELAQKICKDYPQLGDVTVVFPNRRATLYFRKYLAEEIKRPVFTPRLLTIEDFIGNLSDYKIPDKLELVHRLYRSYTDVIRSDEAFDKFYFWGEMLLRDFEEVDKYLVRAEFIFKDLRYQKELDSSFDFLTEEQINFLNSFWGSFDENLTENKKKFIQVWEKLLAVYENFRAQLGKDGLAYEGMMHREVAEKISSGDIKLPFKVSAPPQLLFVGFNALTLAEEVIISFLVKDGVASVIWDTDHYYVNNDAQEAGNFFRGFQKHNILKSTFDHDVPSNFLRNKTINVYGAAQVIGQTKLMAQILGDELAKGNSPEETLVVLPDEKLLLPVLHGVSGQVDVLNVTMGFPLASTPLYNLIEVLIELQMSTLNDHFNHRHVLAILGHPYGVAADAALSQSKRKEILNQNWVSIPGDWLCIGPELYQLVFKACEPTEILNYVRSIVMLVGSMKTLTEFDREYAFHFIKLLNRLEEVLGVNFSDQTSERKQAFKSFLRLFRQLVRLSKIPFSGEPLKGLQVMGVLETRNLDFKNVFILSLNEGAFPSSANKGSYIPHNIRKAYKLPTAEHQDAIFAYLFYRVLQRAENIHLFYNSETDVLGQGEMSRYLQQLIFESGLPINKHVLHNSLHPHEIKPIVVEKDERVFEKLALHCEGEREVKALSPTALSDYLECRLKFYFKYVAKIREAKEVEDELDARMMGNFLHDTMQYFYEQILRVNKTNTIKAGDLENYERSFDKIIDRVFRKAYNLDEKKPVVYDGQRLVVREVVKSFVDKIIMMDKAHTPFQIEAIERDDLKYSIALEGNGNPVVVLGGKVDRVDRKDNLLRVIDYKTGKDNTDMKKGLADLFVRDGERNKAAFQTILYALLYTPYVRDADVRILPGLMNRMNLFEDDFQFGLKIGSKYIDDIRSLLPEFEGYLKAMLQELFDPAMPFDQTTDVKQCKICAYQGICYR